MQVEDFKVGSTYTMTIVPYLDCEPGEEFQRTLKVLEPATKENSLMECGPDTEVPTDEVLAQWRQFLRVQDAKGNVRLQWPGVIVKAEELAA